MTNGHPLPIGSMIGILGNGQLGKMLCLAAAQLGYRTFVFGDDPDGCAFDVATKKICAMYDDGMAIREFTNYVKVVTLEFENIPLRMLRLIGHCSGGEIKVCPGPQVLQISQDRRREKDFARSLGIPTPMYSAIQVIADVEAIDHYPVILKTARNGYDGKGQARVNTKAELVTAWERFDRQDCVVEEVVDFAFEFSVITAVSVTGETKSYSPFHNIHRDGILAETRWPMDGLDVQKTAAAISYAETLAKKLGVVGLLAVEMFFTTDGRILFNEIAPRPHNSGHVTCDCAFTSQFEQAIRAVTGLPLGDPRPIAAGRMVNLLGSHLPANISMGNPDDRVHLYRKKEKAGRKLGHVTTVFPL
jgi:5-(carboxyamino)imidazole ribonucleotide synthase